LQKKVNNPFAELVRSRTYRPKVIQSKKLYDRKKEKKTLKVATKKGEQND